MSTPVDGSERRAKTRLCIEFLARPGWKLSLPTHKTIGVR